MKLKLSLSTATLPPTIKPHLPFGPALRTPDAAARESFDTGVDLRPPHAAATKLIIDIAWRDLY